MSGDIAAIIGGDFDGEGVEATSSFELIPVGWYMAEIEKAEVKKTKDGSGSYLKLVHSIVGEKYSGRKLFHNITLTNNNQTAVDIGMRDLEALRLASELATISDTSDLIGKIMEIRVVVKPAKGDFEADNDVKGWRLSGGSIVQKNTKAEAPEKEEKKPAARVPSSEARVRKPWERT
jgi:hypothetical protein